MNLGKTDAPGVAAIIAETMALSIFQRIDTPEARVEMTAISLQEARGIFRLQLPRKKGGKPGPARGLWQFERRGGVFGVLTNDASEARAVALCNLRGVLPTMEAVHQAIATDDILACGFARLLLFTDPRPLPKLFQVQQAWDYYTRNWQPGSPHPETWPECYALAIKTITGENAP